MILIPGSGSLSLTQMQALAERSNWLRASITKDPFGKAGYGFGCQSRLTPKWNPGKWKHGPKPLFPWWFYFDPYPYLVKGMKGSLARNRIAR